MDSPSSTSSTDSTVEHPFTFFRAFPWLSSHILDAESASDFLDHPGLATYGNGGQEVAVKLTKLEREGSHSQDAPSLESILLGDPASSVSQRLTGLDGLSQERLSSLASLLLDYRLIDVVLSIQEIPNPSGQSSRLGIPIPAKMYYKQASNWPMLVSRGLQLLKDCEDDDHSMDTTAPAADPVVSIFTSLVHRREAIDGHKIHANFECATAHLSLILKGVVDLPSTVPDFKTLILAMCEQEGTSTERWESFFDSIKTVHSFKLPLQLALAVSPVCLFLPCCIMRKDLNRRTLLQMWQGLGGVRPALLSLIETNIWKALFETASGMFPMRPRFRAAFRAIGMIDLAQVGYPSSEWLAGDPSFHESLQPAAIPDRRRGKSKQKPLEPPDLMLMEEDFPAKSLETSSRRSGLRSCSLPPDDGAEIKSEPTTTPRRPNTRGCATAGGYGSARASSPDRRRSIRRGKARAASESMVTGSDSDETDDSDMYTDASPVVHKRTISSVSGTKPARPEHTTKAMKMEDGTRLDVFERIDLSREARGPPIIDLTLDEDGPERPFTSTCTLWLPHGRSKYVARFHYREEAEWFASLFRTMRLCHPKDPNQYFTFLTSLQGMDMATSKLQQLLRRSILVLREDHPSFFNFDSKTLSSFCMLDKAISVVDFSISPTLPRIVTGTLKQLLTTARSSGKALAALDLPIPDGTSPLPSLASDILAWDMTIDTPWCGRQWEMPRSTFRCAEVSTRDSYRPFGISANGSVTQIEVKAGSLLLIACQPSVFNPHSMTSIAMLEQTLQQYISDRKSLDYQAYHLQAGETIVIRPLVPHIILSTANTVSHVSSFYASSTLQLSCIGFLHSSLSRQAASNPSQRASQSILRRLVHYYHAVYMKEEYLDHRGDFPHVPDVFTTDGIIDILSLCNLFEIVNVLAYTLSDFDRHLLIEARRLSRTIVAWLDCRLAFSDQQGRPLNAVQGLWQVYLVHQIKALQVYQEALERRQTSSHPPGEFVRKLQATFADRPDFMARIRAARSGSDHLGWPDDLIFSISLRAPSKPVPDDISGQTGDDIAHFGT